MQRFQDENDLALQSYHQALDLFKTVGDRLGEANTLKAIGGMHLEQGKGETALKLLDEALQLYRQVGDRSGQANIYWLLGITLAQNGHLADAEPLVAQAVELGNQFAPGHPVTVSMENALAQIREMLSQSE